MKRAALALLPLLLWACEPATLPAPSIVSVEPQLVPAGAPSVLTVKARAILPVTVDYQSQAVDASLLAITLWVGEQKVDIPFIERDGTLLAPVPEGLALGDYDIRLALADGREAVREHAFSVVPPSTLTSKPGSDGGTKGDGGADPGTPGTLGDGSGGLTGFQIDPIGAQVRGVPFQVTLRALGPAASSFQDPVSLRVNKGLVTLHKAGTFSEGVRVEELSLSHPGTNMYLLVEDAQGHKGLSNPFQVRPQ